MYRVKLAVLGSIPQRSDCLLNSPLPQDESVSLAKSIIQQFTIPSLSNVVGFYLISMESHDLKNWTHDLVPSPTQLGGCVIVTTTAVFKCQQRWNI